MKLKPYETERVLEGGRPPNVNIDSKEWEAIESSQNLINRQFSAHLDQQQAINNN